MYMDYSNLVLTDREQLLFDRFKNSDFVVLNKDEFLLLRERGLVKGSIDGKSDWFDLPDSGECVLSQRGLEFRAFQAQRKRKERTEQVRHWVPVIISTALSLIAITISVIALLGQLGILQLPQQT